MGIRYNPALDGIRAFAVLGVILYHTRVPFLHAGMLGVDVFFVLSGYLITSILIQQHEAGTFRLSEFYIRRARRLYPALLATVALYLALVTWWWNPWPNVNHWQDAGLALAYLSDYGNAFWRRPEVLRHTWSLSIEEHYYLLWPVVAAWLVRMERAKAVRTLTWICIGATAWRFLSIKYIGGTASGRFDSHCDALLIGSLLAFVPLASAKWKHVAWVFGTMALIALVQHQRAWNMTFTAIASAGLVAWAAQDRPAWLAHPWLAYIGRISYGLYLYHYLVIRYLREIPMGWEGRTAITLLVSFALAILSYHTLEAWFRTSRPRRVSATPTGSAQSQPDTVA